MKTKNEASVEVVICDREHPHYGERGRLVNEFLNVLGTTIAKVELTDCKHGMEGCFVSRGQVKRFEI